MGMLTMTHDEVVEATERSLAENPVLERADGHPCPGCGRHVSGGVCPRCRTPGVGRECDDGPEAGTDPSRPSKPRPDWRCGPTAGMPLGRFSPI